MKKSIKKLSAFFMAVLLIVATFTTTAFAASSTVTYKGRSAANKFVFAPGSYYTETDLFDNFKNVMPGDVRTETVTIKNDYRGSDYIKVWMGAELHNELSEDDKNANPISDRVLDKITENASASDALEYMHEFLSYMTLKVWTVDSNGKETVIYEGSPNSLYKGFENGTDDTDNMPYLGKIYAGKSKKLNVELTVDIEMDNRFADTAGEVDWVFVIEEQNDPSDGPDDRDPKPGRDPEPGTTTPEGPGTMSPQEPEVDYPQILPNVPKTGDDTVIWPYLVLLGVGVVGMVLTVFKKRNKENH